MLLPSGPGYLPSGVIKFCIPEFPLVLIGFGILHLLALNSPGKTTVSHYSRDFISDQGILPLSVMYIALSVPGVSGEQCTGESNILLLFLIDFLCCTEVHPFDGYSCLLSQFTGLVETVKSKAIHENILDLCCIQETFCLPLCAAFISFV